VSHQKINWLTAHHAGATKGQIKVNGYMKTNPVAKHARGFTLVEILVVMGIFVIVMAITGSAFNLIMKQSILQSKIAGSNIEGVIGLEIMRRDLASAGFGLPWSCTVNYPEAAASEPLAAAYNDAAATPKLPSAVSGGNDVILATPDPTQLLQGSDYLVVRATSIGTTQAAQRWSYMNYTGMAKPSPLPPKSWSSENLNGTDHVIVVSMNLSGEFSKDLVVDATDATKFSTTYAALGNFEPQASKSTNFVYGVTTQDPNFASLRMPFNRADYLVRRPAVSESVKIPMRCAPNTGILFKALVNHKDGTFDNAGTSRANELPLLDCVADMQVVYSLQSASTGVVTDTGTLQPLTAAQIRSDLKAIQVYVLTHEGGRDQSYIYPNQFIAVGPSADGINTGTGRSYDLQTTIGTGWQQYRWKVYRMIVNPTNMNISSQ
jgi:prepilin-type N-terminal cleavage/methylation domain-containing protein